MERFHRRVAEIQALLQSREPPLELQVQREAFQFRIQVFRLTDPVDLRVLMIDCFSFV